MASRSVTGQGDAAEALVATVVPGWEKAAAAIDMMLQWQTLWRLVMRTTSRFIVTARITRHRNSQLNEPSDGIQKENYQQFQLTTSDNNQPLYSVSRWHYAAPKRERDSMSKILITDDSTFARLALRKIVAKLEPEWSIIEAGSPAEA